MSKRRPIAERIEAAFGNKSQMPYHALAMIVFPEADFPRAWRYSSNGGPPGCFMALTAALERYGYHTFWGEWERTVYRPVERVKLPAKRRRASRVPTSPDVRTHADGGEG